MSDGRQSTAQQADLVVDPSLACPNCGGQGMAPIFEVDDVPVHSVLLMPTREEAVGYPHGNVRVGFCVRCGFLANTAFDASVHEYSTRYEETQGFSPVFNKFADDLARRMVERYDIRDKTVLEIGCGKGEFLVRMCQFGPNKGIGIDPGIIPDRTPEDIRDSIRWIQDFYPGSYADLQADFICCRHTLEHIPDTLDFLRGVRTAIGDRLDTTIFFELPETIRVLREAAFWDIYYEHCSYFSPGSLARLFRMCGFDLVDLTCDYDDQYIILVAKPVDGGTEPRLGLEDDLEELTALARRFAIEGPAHVARWRDRIKGLAAAGEKIAIWGSGSKAVAFLTTLRLGDEIGMLVDINPFKQGMFMPGTGHEVSSPEALGDFAPDHVVVMNPIYCDEIRADLERMGLSPQLLPV
jgi:SAM-dependent methyltransferase